MSSLAVTLVLGEVEGSRPLRVRNGQVAIRGWCLIAGNATPPEVRLVTNTAVLSQAGRQPRPDLVSSHPQEPAAANCGFLIEGRLPPGVYLARFEAFLPDGSWHCFKTLSLVVEPAPLASGIEIPARTGAVRDRVHVEGWALHPEHTITALSLRYGHQEIPCDLGRQRTDLAREHPHVPHAQSAGFKSRTNLSAGFGPVRLKARLADGSIALARTPLVVDVASDENHPVGFDFRAQRVSLPASPAPAERGLPTPATKPLNILFILPGSFAANHALHAAALANELAASGHACTIAVAHDLSTISHHRDPRFRGVLHADALAGVAIFPNPRGPDIIHAWTTRENVRRLATSLRERHQPRIVVHLEDNEREVLAFTLGRTAAELDLLADVELDRLVPTDLSHPRRAREFLALADGVTLITEPLGEFVPPGRPTLVLPPAADARYFFSRPFPNAFRTIIDRELGETVLFYHGNVHAANAAEVRELYLAVLQLDRAGQPVTLIRSGLDAVDFLGDLAPEVAPHVLSLGQINHHHHLPALMALADIFVQPGAPDAFNDYRFPSKLPEFFAIGRPVVLPRTNLGTVVRHGEDAYVLDRADAAGIAAAVTELRGNPALHAKLSRGALAFAAKHFSWRRSAESLEKFYLSLLPVR